MIDIDDFGNYNFQNTFEKGNNVLKGINEILQLNIEPIEWKKLDGDEFLFTVEGSFDEHTKALTSAMVSVYNDYGLTLSLGLIELEEKKEWKDTIAELRGNLFTAKIQGKNKICISYEICTD